MIGFLGGRRFLVSILVGTVLGGALAWFIAGSEKIPWARGPAPRWVGFSACRSSMLLDMRAAAESRSGAVR